MSTALLWMHPTPQVQEKDPEDDICHIGCDIHEPKLALCGLDVSHLPMEEETPPGEFDCPLCVLVEEEHLQKGTCCPYEKASG